MPSSSARARRRRAISRGGVFQARLCAFFQQNSRQDSPGSGGSSGGPPLWPIAGATVIAHLLAGNMQEKGQPRLGPPPRPSPKCQREKKGEGEEGAQRALATARLVVTPIRCARYSALAWMSAFRPSAPWVTLARASGEKFAVSACSA